MKKLLALTLSLILALTMGLVPASAECRQPVAICDDGGTTTGANHTASVNTRGGASQTATVNGDHNNVVIKQYIGGGTSTGSGTNTKIVYQTVYVPILCPPQPETPDFEAMTKNCAVHGEAFIAFLQRKLAASGWSVSWSLEVNHTHNYVMRVTFFHAASGVRTEEFMLMVYTVTHETFMVALTTRYHERTKIADYPGTECFLRGIDEELAADQILVWLQLNYGIVVTGGCTCGCPYCCNHNSNNGAPLPQP